MRLDNIYCGVVILGLGVSSSQAAGSLEEALTEIADQILIGSEEMETPSLAISTFTHANNTCSDLSNYISEMMLPTVQRAGGQSVRIYARSQLSAIFRELNLIYDGTISPSAAQEVGKFSTVESILSGNITPFGERMMVIATLIATSDGGILSSASTDFPITETVRGMMDISSTAICGFTPAGGAAAPGSASPDAQSEDLPQRPGPSGDTLFSTDVFEARVVSLNYAPSSGEATWSIRFTNTTDTPIGLSYLPGSVSVADGAGGTMTLGDQWSGIRTCYNVSTPQRCNTSDHQYATTLAAGKVAQLNFNTIGAKELQDPALTLTVEFVVTPDTGDPAVYDVRSVGYFDLVPVVR